MNVDFSGTSRGGTTKNYFCFPNSPPWTPSFSRVSVRSWTNFLNPGNAPDSHGAPQGIRWARKSEICGGGSNKVPGPFLTRIKKLNQHS